MISHTPIVFKRKAGGTGAVQATTSLGTDEGAACPCDFYFEPEGVLNKLRVRLFYFPTMNLTTQADAVATRLAAAAYVESLKDTLRWRPPVVKELARGRAVIVNVYDNFGDVEAVPAIGSNVSLMTNCTLQDIRIADDAGVEGVAIDAWFVKVSAAAAVS